MFFDHQNMQYKEKINFEGKKAINGLPSSIWETYSSFANTLGGTIVLGIEENKKGDFQVCGVNDSSSIIKNFWDCIHNLQKVSINLLMEEDVKIETMNEKEIIIIQIPRAPREYRPVYINNNIMSGTYRRNGEGDYHCSSLEIKAMLRDQPESSQDLQVIDNYDISHINEDSLKRYRTIFNQLQTGHVWATLADDEFLYRISAMDKTIDGNRLTKAGLLMFGNDYEIERVFPNYLIDYQEVMDETRKWTHRIKSDQGNWSGNVFDFFFKVFECLSSSIQSSFAFEQEIFREENSNLKIALREAFINCICNADFNDATGVVIRKCKTSFQFENPGIMRVELKRALLGGISDPRNKAIMKMFGFIGLGEKAGTGIPDIFHCWQESNLPQPILKEEFQPDRTILILPYSYHLLQIQSKKALDTLSKEENSVYRYLLNHATCTRKDIEELLHVSASKAKVLLLALIEKELVTSRGANKNRRYFLNGK